MMQRPFGPMQRPGQDPRLNVNPAQVGAGEMPAGPAGPRGVIAGRLDPQVDQSPAVAGVGEAPRPQLR
jgi:hypothetical protein